MKQKLGINASSYQADVADPEAIQAVVNKVVNDFGRLDIVVANAGICHEIEALDFTPKQYREQMSINLDGAFYTAQAAARVFKKQGSGNIIFTTSMSALIVNKPESQAPVCSGYCRAVVQKIFG